MRKFLKWFEIIAGGLLGIALILVVVFFRWFSEGEPYLR